MTKLSWEHTKRHTVENIYNTIFNELQINVIDCQLHSTIGDTTSWTELLTELQLEFFV